MYVYLGNQAVNKIGYEEINVWWETNIRKFFLHNTDFVVVWGDAENNGRSRILLSTRHIPFSGMGLVTTLVYDLHYSHIDNISNGWFPLGPDVWQSGTIWNVLLTFFTSLSSRKLLYAGKLLGNKLLMSLGLFLHVSYPCRLEIYCPIFWGPPTKILTLLSVISIQKFRTVADVMFLIQGRILKQKSLFFINKINTSKGW